MAPPRQRKGGSETSASPEAVPSSSPSSSTTAMTPPGLTNDFKRRPGAYMVAFALTFVLASVLYVNSLEGNFVFDDLPAIVENNDVDSSKSSLWDLLLNNFWGQRMTAHNAQHLSYRPVTVLTFRWNHEVHGMYPLGFHVVNVLLHAAASVLFAVSCMFWLSSPSPLIVGLAGLLFAAHPVHCEAVASLVGRAESLSGLFFLLTFLAYRAAIPFRARPESYDRSRVLVALAFLAAATFSKEQGVTVVGVCVAWDIVCVCQLQPLQFVAMFFGGEQSGDKKTGGKPKRSAPLVWPKWYSALFSRLFVLGAGFVIIMLLRLQMNTQRIDLDEKTNPGNHVKSFPLRVLTKSLYCVLHAWLLIFPNTLSCDWSGGSVTVISSFTDPRNIATLAMYLVLAAFARAFVLKPSSSSSSSSSTNKKGSAPAVVGDESDAVESKDADPSSPYADWFISTILLVVPFLPASGLFMEVGFVLAERVLYLPSMGFCLLLALAASRINTRLPSLKPLVVLLVLAVVALYSIRTFARNEDWRTEVSLYQSAVEAVPNNAKVHHNLAYYLDKDANPDKIEYHLREAIRLYPPYISAYVNLGVHLSRMGKTDEAISMYEEGLRMHYKYPLYSTDVGIFHRNLAAAHLRLGNSQEALNQYKKCLQVSPGHEHCRSQVEALEAELAHNGGSSGRYARNAPQADTFKQKVQHLRNANYDAFLKENDNVLVMFYAPWCGHCKDLKPVYEGLAAMREDTRVVAVDCTEDEKPCEKEKIEGYPTVTLFAKGKKGPSYFGERDVAAMSGFLDQHVMQRAPSPSPIRRTPPQDIKVEYQDMDD